MNPARLFLPDQRLVALPSWQRPRLVLDAELAWRASALLPAQRLSARLMRALLRASAPLRSPRRRAAITEAPVAVWVEGLAPLRPTAVLVGTAGPAQKLTVQFADRSGRASLYAKIAWKAVARRRLRQEATVLAELPPGCAPRPVAYHRSADYDVLLLEAENGRVLRDTRRDAARARRYLEQLAGASARRADGPHPWLLHVREALPELHPYVERLGTRRWPLVAAHGDFAPWNVLANGGRVTAIDWEYAILEALPGFDLAYWRLQADALLARRPPVEARKRAAERVAGALDIGGELAEALVRVTAGWARREALEDGHRADEPLLRWREEVAIG
ncbi:MAG TPA: hypothetical protein ENJ38_01960 [Rhodospirillales bacterium]|nr:hypothetical protein [Rhodospirillales bacterium]